MSEYTSKLESLKNDLLASPKEKLLCVSTTADKKNPKVYFGYMRETEKTIAGNIILRDASILDEVVSIFDGVVSYFLIDCEVKNELQNLEEIMIQKVKKSKIFIYKPNDFAIESIDVFIAILFLSLKGKKVLVVGLGNMGSKIALKMCERGAQVFVSARDEGKAQSIISGLNLIKKSKTDIKLLNQDVSNNIDLILGCTDNEPTITSSMLENMSSEGKIIDLGNDTVTSEAKEFAHKKNIEILKPLITGGYSGMVENWLLQRKFSRPN